MNYNIDNINQILQGDLITEGAKARINHLLTDSRKLIFPAETLFFALTTSRRDGHDFVPSMYEKGVRNFVVSRSPGTNSPADANFIIVRDTLQALQLLARVHRHRFAIPVIGITGSNGKTIVKEWLNQLLEREQQVVRSPGSYNSQIGVPLSLWMMHSKHQIGIFEAGVSKPGEMAALQTMIDPEIGILTNIGAAHSEGFGSLEQKVKEKLQLFTNASLLVYRSGNDLVDKLISSVLTANTRLLSWGENAGASLRITSLHKTNTHTAVIATWNEAELSFSIPFTDDASVENALHCCCLLLHFGYQPSVINERLQKLTPVAMRLELKSGINGSSVINDSYSSDLSSLRIALDFLSQQKQHAKKTVILSDILESGQGSDSLYREVAALLEQHGVHRLIGIGKEISRHSFNDITDTLFYGSVDEFRHNFHKLIFRDETILIKGARVFELEGIDRLLQQKVHQTVLEIDLNAIVHNLNEYRKRLASTTRIMAMVKAFSYGSGSYEIANLLEFHKVDYLAVAYADEGVALRKAGIRLPVMVMNTDEAGFDVLVEHSLEPDLYSREILQAFSDYLALHGIEQFPVHLELETGMNRLGFSESDLSFIESVLVSRRFKVRTIFSHLSASEDPQFDTFTCEQAQRFSTMSAQLESMLGYRVIKHIANSSGSSRHPELQFDMVRIGIGLYGFDSGMEPGVLREVPRLRSTVAQLKKLSAAETVGYGRGGKLIRDSTIATVRIGYADGYVRKLGNGQGKMLVNGQVAPVTGSVCMDMTMIDVTDIPGVTVGDEVIVFGDGISVKTVAQWAGTIPYEILTGISQRVKRVYFEE
ncbi:MAG: bifunctional UDP-N-acetylmuramoyl-tripeptide:D-alanyl-D-alanine ligase/alanine racemase [Chitinophagaceae bacterium]|nr:MAG: bifunctional UDP-N-acetylmuramoyl-tripeptide:D-alanyl-D-alanine ligase/alanine racemase [Chitinophagaceae bacterium]